MEKFMITMRSKILDPLVWGVNEGNALKNTLCPFSLEKLIFLRDKGVSQSKIAVQASAFRVDSKKFHQGTVAIWFRVAGIAGLPLSVAQRISHRVNPAMKESAQKWARGPNSSKQKESASKTGKRNIRKAHSTRLRRCKERQITFICECGCGASKTVKPSHYNQSTHHFFSRSCSARYYGHIRHIESITGNPQAKSNAIEEKNRQKAEALFGRSIPTS